MTEELLTPPQVGAQMHVEARTHDGKGQMFSAIGDLVRGIQNSQDDLTPEEGQQMRECEILLARLAVGRKRRAKVLRREAKSLIEGDEETADDDQ